MTGAGADGTAWDHHVDRLVAALLGGDAVRARSEVHGIVSDGATTSNVYERLIAPALHRVGAAWACGDIDVAVEHRAHQICVALVTELSDLFGQQSSPRGTAVTLTPPEERHALASWMVADFLRSTGYAVHHLGADVPVADLAMFVKVVPADLVCFSVTQPLAADQYRRLVDASREADPDTAVVFGGQGVDRDAVAAAGGMVVDGLGGLLSHLGRATEPAGRVRLPTRRHRVGHGGDGGDDHV